MFDHDEIESAACIEEEGKLEDRFVEPGHGAQIRLELIPLGEHISKPISSSEVRLRALHSSKRKASFKSVSWNVNTDCPELTPLSKHISKPISSSEVRLRALQSRRKASFKTVSWNLITNTS